MRPIPDIQYSELRGGWEAAPGAKRDKEAAPEPEGESDSEDDLAMLG